MSSRSEEILHERVERFWQQEECEVGELVLLQDDDIKRGKWPLGRIVKVNPSEDGIVRVAEVRTKNGTYTRPATKLYKLEDNGNELSN